LLLVPLLGAHILGLLVFARCLRLESVMLCLIWRTFDFCVLRFREFVLQFRHLAQRDTEVGGRDGRSRPGEALLGIDGRVCELMLELGALLLDVDFLGRQGW